ncbi:MAG: hypothetical protein UHU19_12670 [Lachnospiraceae bacterium]|nr:hypothetical protein [Lachnospiraceae bacterium]
MEQMKFQSNNKYMMRYKSDARLKVKTFLLVSVVINGLYAVWSYKGVNSVENFLS